VPAAAKPCRARAASGQILTLLSPFPLSLYILTHQEQFRQYRPLHSLKQKKSTSWWCCPAHGDAQQKKRRGLPHLTVRCNERRSSSIVSFINLQETRKGRRPETCARKKGLNHLALLCDLYMSTLVFCSSAPAAAATEFNFECSFLKRNIYDWFQLFLKRQLLYEQMVMAVIRSRTHARVAQQRETQYRSSEQVFLEIAQHIFVPISDVVPSNSIHGSLLSNWFRIKLICFSERKTVLNLKKKGAEHTT